MSDEEKEILGVCLGLYSDVEEAIRKFENRLNDYLGPMSAESNSRRKAAAEAINEFKDCLEEFKGKVEVG